MCLGLKKGRMAGSLRLAKERFFLVFGDQISKLPTFKRFFLIANVGFFTGVLMEWTMIKSGYCNDQQFSFSSFIFTDNLLLLDNSLLRKHEEELEAFKAARERITTRAAAAAVAIEHPGRP